MAASIVRNRIRVKVDNILLRNGPLSEKLTSSGLVMYQAEDAQIELGIYSNAVKASDLTNFASVTLLLKDSENLLGAPLISSVQTTVVAVSDANWLNDSAQDALFLLTNSDTNIELNGRAYRNMAIIFFGTTTDVPARRIPFSRGQIQLLDSGFGDLGSITVTSPGARMKASRLQVKNQTDGLYYDLVYRTVDGSVTWSVEGAGEA